MTVFYFYFLFPWFPSLICLDLNCFVGFSEGTREVALRGVSFCRAERQAAPAAHSNLQTGSDRNGLTREYGKTGTAAAFPRHS